MKLTQFVALVLVAVFSPLGATAALAVRDDEEEEKEQVCAGSHIAGDEPVETYTAPDGFLVAGYCVKAGSVEQGNGPEYVTLPSPVKSVDVAHSSGKDVSHFSVTLVGAVPEPTPSPTAEVEPTPVPEPTPSATPEPSPPPTETPDEEPTPTATVPVVPEHPVCQGPEQGCRLPNTGAATSWLVVLGGCLLAGGSAASYAGRRLAGR